MASARPGPIPQRTAITKTTPPPAPEYLTDQQREVWDELANNPLLTKADSGLLRQFLHTLALHEQAHQSLVQDGMLVSGYRNELKPNPAYRIYQQTSQLLVTLRTALMATPAARIKALQSVALVDDQPDEFDLEID